MRGVLRTSCLPYFRQRAADFVVIRQGFCERGVNAEKENLIAFSNRLRGFGHRPPKSQSHRELQQQHKQEQNAFEKTPYRNQRLLLGQCPLDSQTVLQLALIADDDFILWR